MTVLDTGAPSSKTIIWHEINWVRCYRNVRRLQMRIVKALREGRHGKVKALQWLLTHSFSGKVLAVRRVTENRGKKTPGIDRVTWSTPTDKSGGVASLRRRGYNPLPLRRVYIPKSNDKLRPLGIPTMKDRAMQALYLLALEPVAETTADKNSYGFRPQRCTADAIGQCFNVLARKDAVQYILEGDICACFDKISHEWLINNISMDRIILQKWLKAGYVENCRPFPTEEGTPQGGIASPALANMTLDNLEAELAKTFCRKEKVHLVRYADDFIITGESRELLEQKVKPLVSKFLETRALEFSLEKTRIVHISEGFDFLGQNIRKYGEKLFIKPSKKSVQSLIEKARKIIKSHQASKQEVLIALLASSRKN